MTGPVTEPGSVVVGVDGTADGDRAVAYGAMLAVRERLRLRLVHVPHESGSFTPVMPYLPSASVREIGDSVLRDAARHAEKAGADPGRISTVLGEGPRTEALLRHVADARQLVLGTRASSVQHLFTGATSLSVAAHSPVPVHCVPRRWAADRSPTGRLVVGVDGSEADPLVLQEAFAEAHARAARLEVVHAWRPVSPYDAAITGRVLRDDWDRTARDALRRRIEDAAAARAGVDWTLRLEYERVPVALHAAAEHADLLILGRHGHRTPLGLRVGSNTRTLLRTATCPVVVVPVRPEGQ